MGGGKRGSPPPPPPLPPPPSTAGNRDALKREIRINRLLVGYPGIKLDDQAKEQLQKAHPNRAEEILDEIQNKGHEVRNASAFVFKAIQTFPLPRGERAGGSGPDWDSSVAKIEWKAQSKRANADHKTPEWNNGSKAVAKMLKKNPEVANALDEGAKQKLLDADPERAIEIIEDVASKDEEIRNMSAFVCQALRTYPYKRGIIDQEDRINRFERIERSKELDGLLSEYPRTASLIDEKAYQLLKECETARATEIIQDVVAKRGDVRNVSAFVAKAAYMSKTTRESVSVATDVDLWRSLDMLLGNNPKIKRALDETAMGLLYECEAARSVEVIRDVVAKGNVKNPSAFVTNALNKFPCKRGGAEKAFALATRERDSRSKGDGPKGKEKGGAQIRSKSAGAEDREPRGKRGKNSFLDDMWGPYNSSTTNEYTQINIVNYNVISSDALPAALRNGNSVSALQNDPKCDIVYNVKNGVKTPPKAVRNGIEELSMPATPPKVRPVSAGSTLARRRDILAGSSQGEEHSESRGILWRCAALRLRAALEECMDVPQPDPGVEILGQEALCQGIKDRAESMASVLLNSLSGSADELVELCVTDDVLAMLFGELGLSRAFGAPGSKASRAEEVRRTAGQLSLHSGSNPEAHAAFGALCEFAFLLGCTIWSDKN